MIRKWFIWCAKDFYCFYQNHGTCKPTTMLNCSHSVTCISKTVLTNHVDHTIHLNPNHHSAEVWLHVSLITNISNEFLVLFIFSCSTKSFLTIFQHCYPSFKMLMMIIIKDLVRNWMFNLQKKKKKITGIISNWSVSHARIYFCHLHKVWENASGDRYILIDAVVVKIWCIFFFIWFNTD